jgi:predicted transcriptional regulator
MARNDLCTLTPLEAAVMNVVWEASEATTRQVHEKLQETTPRAYNTVLTVMRILHQKGLLDSDRGGRTVVYRPTVTRAEGAQYAIKELADRFFACSVPALLSHLVQSVELSKKELRAVQREVNRRLDEPRRGKR